MLSIIKGLGEILVAIDTCIERKMQIPALVLIYATIDSCGWLVSGDEKVRKRFEAWIERFLFAERALPCSATDLYSARCGILHTLTGESDLIRDGKAKTVAYAWGNGEVSVLQAIVDHDHPGQCVAIHINDLVEAVKLGIDKMLDEADADPKLAELLNGRSERLFANLDSAVDFSSILQRPGLGGTAKA